ncbi:MAG: DUF4296 domain-containing protein [Bacteroidia bacterium]|nr:DUF4296 domain-containing protein [Bacteroidia bacterium]
MKIRLFVLFFLISIAACNNRNNIPNGILKPSKMQAVMWDIVRADQLFNNYARYGDTSGNSTNERIKLYQLVFSIHNISKEKFQQSFSFYQAHPDLMKVILDSINNIQHPIPD